MDTRIRCILIDDELPGLNYLKLLCSEIAGVEVVKAYDNALKALEDSTRIDYDICLLDIEMPGMNGMELARRLSHPVIFITAYKQYAVDAFEVNAIDYLMKPINLDRLRKAMEKAATFMQLEKAAPQPALFNTDRGKALVDFNDVAIIATSVTDARDKLLLYKDGSTTMLLKNVSFGSLQTQLPARMFVRINKKELVAVRAVGFYSHTIVSVTLQDGTLHELPLGSSYRDDFLAMLTG